MTSADRTDEYEEGREAFRLGLNAADNPHPNGSKEANDWDDGLFDAKCGWRPN